MFAKPATLTSTALLFLGIGLAPLMALLVSSLSVDGVFGLDRYQHLWSSPKPLQLFGHSLLLSGLTTLIVTVLGVPLGILSGKGDLQWRTPFLVLFTLPLLIPPYFLSLGWFSLLRSLFYAAVGASLLTVTGFFLGLLWRERTCCSGITQFTALLLLILPGTVIGIGLIGLWNTPATAWIYASPGILIMGYVIQYAALPSGILHAVLTRLPPSLEQAAALSGAGWWRRLLLIVLPLSRRGLLLAWLVSYLFCLRDTGLAMLVYPPGEDTLINQLTAAY